MSSLRRPPATRRWEAAPQRLAKGVEDGRPTISARASTCPGALISTVGATDHSLAGGFKEGDQQPAGQRLAVHGGSTISSTSAVGRRRASTPRSGSLSVIGRAAAQEAADHSHQGNAGSLQSESRHRVCRACHVSQPNGILQGDVPFRRNWNRRAPRGRNNPKSARAFGDNAGPGERSAGCYCRTLPDINSIALEQFLVANRDEALDVPRVRRREAGGIVDEEIVASR